MRYIEPHGHMVSRTTDDYQAMVNAMWDSGDSTQGWAQSEKLRVEN